MKKIYIVFVLLASISMLNFSCKTETNENEANVGNNAKFETNATPVNKNVVHLTAQTFKEKVFNYDVNTEWKYEGNVPCIVDFYADWCGPCKRIAPILEDLAKEYDGKLIVYKVDTETERELAAAFQIQSIPSLLFCPVEGQPQMAKGALPKETFKEVIQNVLLVK
ncbi:MAG: thioredoxin [Bacteroidales bacterium]|nr:thioredoxin [Bacteroidales bacterium]